MLIKPSGLKMLKLSQELSHLALRSARRCRHHGLNMIRLDVESGLNRPKCSEFNNFYSRYYMSESNQEKKIDEQPPQDQKEQGGKKEPKAKVIGEDGKELSKNQQKYLEKQRQKEEEKKKKEEEKKKKAEEDVAKGIKKEKKAVEEEIIDPTAYYESRSTIIQHLKEIPEKYPYPHKFNVTHTHKAFHEEFNPLCTENNAFLDTKTASIAGKYDSEG